MVVRNYFGDYASYLQSVESEIDSGERERNLSAGKSNLRKLPKQDPLPIIAKPAGIVPQNGERDQESREENSQTDEENVT